MQRPSAPGESAGVAGGKLFVVVNDTITFVPLTDLVGKSEEAVKEIVVEKVTETVTESFTQQAIAEAGLDINLAEEAAILWASIAIKEIVLRNCLLFWCCEQHCKNVVNFPIPTRP